MNEADLELILADMLMNNETYTDACEDQDLDESQCSLVDVRSFEEAMIMTQNRGLVVRLTDGTEYQITIVRSK